MVINCICISGSIIPIYIGNYLLDRAWLFIIIGLVILLFVWGYLTLVYFKKRFAFVQGGLNAKNKEIDGQIKENLKLEQERTKLENKLKEFENEQNRWEEDKNRLLKEIEALKEHIKKLEEEGSDKNNDIIIEYYMNENS
jgi:septal ring factor EnvC (AmiA/AmiB activator)